MNYMRNNSSVSKVLVGVVISMGLSFAPGIAHAGLLGNLLGSLLDGIKSVNSGKYGENKDRRNGSPVDPGSGFGSNNYTNPGTGSNSNPSNSPSTGTVVSSGSGAVTGAGAGSSYTVAAVASDGSILRCPASVYNNIKFPQYRAGTAQPMPGSARADNFTAELPSGQNLQKTRVACSAAITPQAVSVDGNRYQINGDMDFTCHNGSWMLTNSGCYAEQLPPSAVSTVAAGVVTGSGGSVCPAGYTPVAGVSGGVSNCSKTTPGGYPATQTVPTCANTTYNSPAGC